MARFHDIGPTSLLPAGKRRERPAKRRAVMLIYVVVLMTMFIAVTSLAVDYGRVQLVKTQMQRTADASARGYVEYYILQGASYASANAPALGYQSNNPVDSHSGISPTITVQAGYWTPGNGNSPGVFSTSSGTSPAACATVTRTSANGNAVSLVFGAMFGFPSIDVHATAIAVEMGGQSTAVNIPSTASLYLAGMSSGSSAAGGDTLSNAAPNQITSIPVVPGSYMTFSNLTGTTTVSPGGVPYSGPAGGASYPVHHGQSWNNNPNSPGAENGVADAIIDEDATVGMFLTGQAPNLSTAPATVDWTVSSQNNNATYSNLQNQQPFLIGSGQTTNQVTKKFLVPPGATRFFLSIWDGYQYNNNAGALSGTVTVQPYVQLVQ